MRLIYDYKLPTQVQLIHRKIVQESTDLAKRFLECFRKESNKEIIRKLAEDPSFVKSHSMLSQLFS